MYRPFEHFQFLHTIPLPNPQILHTFLAQILLIPHLQLFTTTTEISEANLTAAATLPEATNEQNTVEDELILTGIQEPKPAATPFASTSTGGFVFDYLE